MQQDASRRRNLQEITQPEGMRNRREADPTDPLLNPHQGNTLMNKSTARNSIKYFGWSSILVTSDQGGDLAFDPFFSSDYGTHWSELLDFQGVTVICVSHGHHEHYTDTHKVVSRTGATVVAPRLVCDHLASHFRVPPSKLHPIASGETVNIDGYEISAFPWYHRRINYFKFFAGHFLTGCKFVLTNLLHTPFDTPFYGYVVTTPEGTRILNMTEGMNSGMPTSEVEALANRYEPEVLVGGWQLNFENDVARCVRASSVRRCVLYHPHEQLFGLMRIESTPLGVVLSKIHEVAPDVLIDTPTPRSSVIL